MCSAATQCVLHDEVHTAQAVHIITSDLSLDHITEVFLHPLHGQYPFEKFIVFGISGIYADIAGIALVTSVLR